MILRYCHTFWNETQSMYGQSFQELISDFVANRNFHTFFFTQSNSDHLSCSEFPGLSLVIYFINFIYLEKKEIVIYFHLFECFAYNSYILCCGNWIFCLPVIVGQIYMLGFPINKRILEIHGSSVTEDTIVALWGVKDFIIKRDNINNVVVEKDLLSSLGDFRK